MADYYVMVILYNFAVKCKKVDNREYQDELTVEGNDVPQSADVVFVIQHADCNNDMIDQLSAAVGDLEQKMTQTGLTNNRYGIVGYGSLDDLNEPHTHTMDGQIFNTQDKFTQVCIVGLAFDLSLQSHPTLLNNDDFRHAACLERAYGDVSMFAGYP